MKNLEIKSSWITHVVPTSDDKFSYKRQKRRPCEDGGGDWSDTVTNQEEAGRGKESFSLKASEGAWPY